jgi:hypothetical protein
VEQETRSLAYLNGTEPRNYKLHQHKVVIIRQKPHPYCKQLWQSREFSTVFLQEHFAIFAFGTTPLGNNRRARPASTLSRMFLQEHFPAMSSTGHSVGIIEMFLQEHPVSL